MKKEITIMRRGWLIPGNILKFENNTILKLSKIDSFNYYTNNNNDDDEHYILFNGITKWRYNSKDDLITEFNRILKIIIPEDENLKGVFE